MERCAVILAGMAQTYRKAPSNFLHIDDPMTAWCLDTAIYELIARLKSGEQLRPAKRPGEDNIAQLKRLGVKIEGLKE